MKLIPFSFKVVGNVVRISGRFSAWGFAGPLSQKEINKKCSANDWLQISYIQTRRDLHGFFFVFLFSHPLKHWKLSQYDHLLLFGELVAIASLIEPCGVAFHVFVSAILPHEHVDVV